MTKGIKVKSTSDQRVGTIHATFTKGKDAFNRVVEIAVVRWDDGKVTYVNQAILEVVR